MRRPPDTTDQILSDIRRSNAGILITSQAQLSSSQDQLVVLEESLEVQKELLESTELILTANVDQLAVEKEQLKEAKLTRHIAQRQLAAQHSQLKLSSLILKALRDILELPKLHVYTLHIDKERPKMSVIPGTGAGFKVIMLDNGNPIDPPEPPYTWTTDDSTDTIEDLSIDQSMSSVKITTTDPPTEGRTSMSVTVTATDPAGEEITGELTVDLIPAQQNVFTLVVQQTFEGDEPVVNPLQRNKAAQLPAETGTAAGSEATAQALRNGGFGPLLLLRCGERGP